MSGEPSTLSPNQPSTTLYFYCPETNKPFGGIKNTYRHVEGLNHWGFSAAVLHRKDGFRCTWFKHQTPIVYASELTLRPKDIVVIPESLGLKIQTWAKGTRKVIFNRNCYYTFVGYPLTDEVIQSPYVDPEFIAAIVVSEDSRRYLNYAFPQLKVIRIRNPVDPAVFYSHYPKKKQICFMPRKNEDDINQVINLLKFRNILEGFTIAPIHQQPEERVAEILRESMIFLSSGHPEGWGASAAEAMQSGCVVIGYHGQGGQEFFRPDFCFPIAFGNIIDFAQTVEKVIYSQEQNPEFCQNLGTKASAFIQQNYSPTCHQQDTIRCWSEIIQMV